MNSRGCRAGDAMLASAQAARMGQVDESQEEASTSEASSAHMQPWRHSSSSSSRATDTGILLADGEIGSEQHKIDKKRAIEKFFKEKEKRRRLGVWHPGPLYCLCRIEHSLEQPASFSSSQG